MQVRLTCGNVYATIDDDLPTWQKELIVKANWTLEVRKNTCYACNRKFRRLHQFILGTRPGYVIHHINLNGLDCRRANLRFVSKSLNGSFLCGRTPTESNKLGVLGVRQRKDGLWHAKLVFNGTVHEACFSTQDEAIAFRRHWEDIYRATYLS